MPTNLEEETRTQQIYTTSMSFCFISIFIGIAFGRFKRSQQHRDTQTSSLPRALL